MYSHKDLFGVQLLSLKIPGPVPSLMSVPYLAALRDILHPPTCACYPVCSCFTRYKEHEDGYMRLQLVRYESVELTQQLLRQPQEGSGLGASLNESSLQGIILEAMPGEPGPQEEAEEEEEGGSSEGTGLSASQDTPSPVIHVVNQTNAQGDQEIVYYVLSEAPGEPPPAPEPPSGDIMEKLQGIAEEPEVRML